ncbi:MAG: hypothetical protein JXL80_05735 [Planctomycetes bacterium]|nr:hypothetical protein [Planctomycetota bacterium]
MAGDWIKVRTNIHEQREIVIVARQLGLVREHVVGLCVRFWGWADSNTADGNLPNMTGGDLDEIVGVEGFSEAMKLAGWLVEDERGLLIPNHDRHNGTSAKKRALAMNRKQAQRSREASR